MRAARDLGLLVLTIVVAAGCRVTTRGTVSLDDDIDAIEAALAERDAELTNEGIVVAYRDPRLGAGERPTGKTETSAAADAPAGEGAEPITPTAEAPPTSEPAPNDDSPEDEDAPLMSSRREPTSPSGPDSPASERESNRERRAKRATRASARDRCETRCALVEPTCGLRDRICDLAERHAGDERYLRACDRAEDQCTATEQQCSNCAV